MPSLYGMPDLGDLGGEMVGGEVFEGRSEKC